MMEYLAKGLRSRYSLFNLLGKVEKANDKIILFYGRFGPSRT